MFTLAQYVLGIGKSDIFTGENTTSNDTACYENDENSNQCVQTNIENDWILIEIGDKNSNSAKDGVKTILCTKKAKLKSKKAENLPSQEESWFVEPPECFKNISSDSRDVKTSSIEDLLIEHPSMSVFDNLFTKRVTVHQIDHLKKQNLKIQTCKVENCKENSPTARPSNKKKQIETNSVNVLSVSNQNKAFTAVIQSSEKFNKKKSITKKNYDRKNMVAIQRNGPIIRHKKMFTHFNGVYHNRNHC